MKNGWINIVRIQFNLLSYQKVKENLTLKDRLEWLILFKLSEGFTPKTSCPKGFKFLEQDYSRWSALIAEPPISLADFSRLTGISISTAKRFTPDLCEELVFRYKNYRVQLKEERIINISEEIETQMIDLQDRGVYPSIKQIQKEISDPNVFIKDTYRDIWREKMLKLGYKI